MEKDKTALLVMDFENDMIDEKGKVAAFGMAAHARKQNAVENTAKLLNKARDAGIKVIFVKVGYSKDYREIISSKEPVQQMTPQTGAMIWDTWGTEFPEQLKPEASELVIKKSRISPFSNPQFEENLKGIETLILTGVATNFVVESTARTAADLDYEVIVIEDCCASLNQEMHDFSIKNILPNIAKVISSKELLESWA